MVSDVPASAYTQAAADALCQAREQRRAQAEQEAEALQWLELTDKAAAEQLRNTQAQRAAQEADAERQALEAQARTDRIYHLDTDHLGTPQEAYADDGKVVWLAHYRAWGRIQKLDKAEITQPFRFQGQYEDEETGLYYNRHRYYDPDSARYLTQDPIGLAGGNNLYQYAPNPNGWTDPKGLKTVWQENWEAVHGPLPPGYQVHHIIPKSKSSVAAARKICPNFDVHSADNLIALPIDSSIPQQTGQGFGKTTHQGYHAGYSQAAEAAMKVAGRFNKPGLSGCAKLNAVQSALRNQLERGGQTMYGNQHPQGVPGVAADWKTAIRNGVRSGQ